MDSGIRDEIGFRSVLALRNQQVGGTLNDNEEVKLEKDERAFQLKNICIS